MSIVLFKDGEPGVFEVNEMGYLLEQGWSTEENSNDGQREDEPQKEKESDEKEDEEDETPEDVRELAKEAGIEGWENKRIKTLKAELNEQQT